MRLRLCHSTGVLDPAIGESGICSAPTGLTGSRAASEPGSTSLSVTTPRGHCGRPLIVDQLGPDDVPTYTELDDTISLARRVSQRGAYGSVHVTMHTRRLLGDAFITRDAGEYSTSRQRVLIKVFEVLRPSGWYSRIDRYQHGVDTVRRATHAM
jgi:hypothetical protein